MDEYAEALDGYDPDSVHEIDSLWNLAEDFSVEDAASLVAGYNPEMVERCASDSFFHRAFPRYQVAFKALTKAIINGRVKANIRHQARDYGYADQIADIEYSEVDFVRAFGTTAEEGEVLANDHSCFYKPFPSWRLSTVSRGDLVEWLKSRNITSGFFFAETSSNPDYLDSKHPRYAPKLAAAVRAWQAVTDPCGRHPKQALAKWLREHAAEFGMTDDEGKVNELGIDEAAKVANWRPGGGAPKTPGQ